MLDTAHCANQIPQMQYANSIDLSSCEVTDGDCLEVAAALNQTKTVTSLSLAGNPVGDQCAIAIAASLTANTSLQSLNFLACTAIGPAGVTALAKALAGNPPQGCPIKIVV